MQLLETYNTEVEILEKGNKFIGNKRGLITTEDNVKIESDQFDYDKSTNILKLSNQLPINQKTIKKISKNY